MRASFSARHVLQLAALAIGLLFAQTATAQESRTWTDATGQHKIQAKFQKLSDGKVTLLCDDGSAVEIELKQLSAADQTYVAEQKPSSPFKPAKPSPFKPKPRDAAEPAAAPAATDSGGEPKTITPNWASATSVPLMPDKEGWKFDVPPVAPAEPGPSRSIAIPQKSHFFEKARAVVVSHSGQRLLIGYVHGEPKPLGVTRLVLCDLSKGRMLMTATTPGQLAPMALSDNGTQVLMRRDEWGFGNQDRLELWSLSPSGITKVWQTVPHNDVQGGGRDIPWAAFVDGQRFATLGGSGKLAVWNATTGQPLSYLQVDGGSQPALSPDRKHLAFATGKQVGILDLASGKVVALQPTAHLPWPKLRFSPDGTRLVCVAHDRINIWNFDDGTLYREIPLAGQNVFANEIIWPRDQFLLLGNTRLFDIENQVPLWTYSGHELVAVTGGMCAFVVSDHNAPGAVILAPVPSPGFDVALAAAMRAPDFFVFKPGVTVKLNVDALPDAGEREKVRAWLTQKLQQRGCQAGPQGTIELVATTEAGKEREISYHGFGISPWRTHKVREHITHLKFVYQGQAAWQTQGSSIPGVISLKEGETIDQVLRRSEKPNYSLYEHVELPKMLIKPSNQGGLGTSRVTVAGVQ